MANVILAYVVFRIVYVFFVGDSHTPVGCLLDAMVSSILLDGLRSALIQPQSSSNGWLLE